MIQLSPRQVQVLKTIIEEHINTAEPVGSEMLDKKHALGVSPATIRNEMAQLTNLGLLKQPHVSAGRIPTSQALKFYVSELMKEQDLSVTEEASVKERIWDARSRTDALLREAVRALSDKTQCVGLAVTSQGDIYHAGSYHLLDQPEFFDIDVAKAVFSLLDKGEDLLHLFSSSPSDHTITVLLGEDLNYDHLDLVAIVFSDFQFDTIHGSIGIIGPARLQYPYVIPLIRLSCKIIQDTFHR